MSQYDPGVTSSVTLSEGLGSVSPGFAAHVENSNQVDEQVKRLRETNSLYDAYAPLWETYLACYEGGPDVERRQYLHTHIREQMDDYDKRLERLHYLNFCKPLVDFFTYFIYSDTIQRSGGKNDAWYQDFIKDVNLKGEDIVTFMKQVADDAQIFGMSYILVDSPTNPFPDDAVVTQAVVEEMKLRPYWVLLKAPEIIDWDIDPFERLLYLKRKEITSGRNQRNARRVYEKYTEWFPDRVDITYVDVTNAHEPKIVPSMGTTVPNRVGEIPIQIVRYERSKRYPYMGNSFLRDFSNNNLQVMNLTSLIDEFNYKQCFNILAKEEDANALPLRDGNDGVVGVGNVMEYPKGAKPPAYITPPADPAKFMQSERDYIIQQMFKRAAQDMMSELFNGEGASGFSQAQSFAKTVPFISNRADTLEAAENALMTRTLKYLNKTWDGKIKYKDRYELTNITDALTQLLMLFRDLQLPSETFVKEELKRLVHEMDGKLPADTLNKVLHEIDELDFDEWQEVQKEALVGKPSSPGEQNQPKSTGTTAEAASEAKAQTASTSKIRKKNNK